VGMGLARSKPGINQLVADKLRQAADLLEQQDANPFRVNAFRRGADTVAALGEPVTAVLEAKGIDGLVALPTIGRGIANAIDEIVRTGSWAQLERLRGTLDPEKLFRTVPGIGPGLAHRIHEALHVDTLEALETAAHNGRLEQVPGVGARRVASIRASLKSTLGRVPRRSRPDIDGPEVKTLLQVDEEYRDKAAADSLPKIAPRRFNPENEAWLPILHTRHGNWHFTTLFSNTARAHEQKKMKDWVVVYFYDDQHQEGQHTIVTETRGSLAGKRVVRGREAECREYYRH
jgi:hypothetical protein